MSAVPAVLLLTAKHAPPDSKLPRASPGVLRRCPADEGCGKGAAETGRRHALKTLRKAATKVPVRRPQNRLEGAPKSPWKTPPKPPGRRHRNRSEDAPKSAGEGGEFMGNAVVNRRPEFPERPPQNHQNGGTKITRMAAQNPPDGRPKKLQNAGSKIAGRLPEKHTESPPGDRNRRDTCIAPRPAIGETPTGNEGSQPCVLTEWPRPTGNRSNTLDGDDSLASTKLSPPPRDRRKLLAWDVY